jgi:hypothetical protein
MRSTLGAIVLVGLPVLAGAQSWGPESGPVHPPPSIGLPLPSIGLPLPTIGIPHRPMGVPVPGAPAGEARARPPHHRYPRHHPAGLLPVQVVPVLIWPVFVQPVALAPDPGTVGARPVSSADTGRLRLDLRPAATDAQVFVDGIYQGVLVDVEDGLDLDPGTRALEVRAAGHEPHTAMVSIVADRTTRYRAELTPLVPVLGAISVDGPSTSQPRVPTTFYEVPGCYLGNVPPAEADPPAGCDLSRTRTIRR